MMDLKGKIWSEDVGWTVTDGRGSASASSFLVKLICQHFHYYRNKPLLSGIEYLFLSYFIHETPSSKLYEKWYAV